eukprot:6330236-Prymnesium_polylepis.1
MPPRCARARGEALTAMLSGMTSNRLSCSHDSARATSALSKLGRARGASLRLAARLAQSLAAHSWASAEVG